MKINLSTLRRLYATFRQTTKELNSFEIIEENQKCVPAFLLNLDCTVAMTVHLSISLRLNLFTSLRKQAINHFYGSAINLFRICIGTFSSYF